MKTALCMPVGPRGVLGPTAQYLCALVARGTVSTVLIATGHLVRARNTLVGAARERADIERILWLDSDVWCSSADDLGEFIRRGEDAFAAHSDVAWYSAICMMRGTGLPNYQSSPSVSPMHTHPCAGRGLAWYAGLGLQYWHLPRYIAAGAPAFRWVEPMSEDIRMCDDLARAGFFGMVDHQLSTVHDGQRWFTSDAEAK